MLVISVSCPGGFLYLNVNLFLEIWDIFCYYFVEYITYTFGLHILSFNDHDSQIWSVTELLSPCIFLSQFLSLLSKNSSDFS
jgi:hypothetical protein